MTTKSVESKVRRAAKTAGLIAKKSRKGVGSINNQGGFCLIDAATNLAVYGRRYELDAEEAIDYCVNGLHF